MTIRAVADSLGYASPLLYEHFRNKEDLMAAATRQGFAELAAELSAVAPDPGSDERLLALGRAYLAFAQRAPELYRVMHGLEGTITPSEAMAEGAQQLCDGVLHELQAWERKAGVKLQDPLGSAEAIWCLVHGVASLTLAGRLEPGHEERLSDTIRALLAGWRNS